MNSIPSNSSTRFADLHPPILGLVMASSGDEEEMAALANIHGQAGDAFSHAHQTIYEAYKGRSNTLMGRIIHQLENSPLQVVPNGFSLKLLAVREQTVEHLLQNRLMMEEAWAPILEERQIGDLSYQELNELGRLLQEIRDHDLVAFMRKLGNDYPFIQEFLGSIDHLSPDEKAETLRAWMGDNRGQFIEIDPTQTLIVNDPENPFGVPLELSYFSPEASLICGLNSSLKAPIDTGAIIEMLRQPWQDQETKSLIVKAFLIQLIPTANLEAFQILHERGMFTDLNDAVLNDVLQHDDDEDSLIEGLDPGGDDGLEPDLLEIMRAAIALPSRGFLFLTYCFLHCARTNIWRVIGTLLEHPKMEELLNKELPAAKRPVYLEVIAEIRDLCAAKNRPVFAARFQEIIDLRNQQWADQ